LTLNLQFDDILYIFIEGARGLSSGNLTNLTTLHFASNYIRTEGARALFQGNLMRLTAIYLTDSYIGVEGVRAISQGNLTRLITLDLEYIALENMKENYIQKDIS
jgi:hypothetical protein